MIRRLYSCGIKSFRTVSIRPSFPSLRLFSSVQDASAQTEKPAASEQTDSRSSSTDLKKFNEDEYDDWEPKTAKEKVSYYSQLAFILGLLGLGAGCIYVFIREVNPFGISPQAIFDQAVDKLVIRDEVSRDWTYFYMFAF